MNQEEVNKIRQMSLREIQKKYFKLYLDKELTKRQYFWLQAQAKDINEFDRTLFTLVAAFGGHIEDVDL